MKMDRNKRKEQIHSVIDQNILEKGWVAPVDVLIGIGVLSKENYENWRFGRVAFLEKVCSTNIQQLSEIMKEIQAYARASNLKPSWSYYRQYGSKSTNKLRFSKSGAEKIEYNYATHYINGNIQPTNHSKKDV